MVTWADALAATGTVGAFVVGLVLFGLQAWDRYRTQAVCVTAWAEEVTELREANDLGVSIAPGGQSVRLNVHNGSGAPVHDFMAYVYHNYSKDSGSTGGLYPGPVIPPGDIESWVDGVDSTPQVGLPLVSIEFRDGFGRRWRRRPDGKLTRVIGGRKWARWRRKRDVAKMAKKIREANRDRT